MPTFRTSVAPLLVAALAGAAAAQPTSVFPTAPHAAFNFIPLGAATTGLASDVIQHQVFTSSLFGNTPVEITAISFAPNNSLANQTHNLGDVTIRLGYTDRAAGVLPPTGLDIPAGAGGAPNASGAMHLFFSQKSFIYTVVAGGTENFEVQFVGTPFVYDPAQGNLLVAIEIGDTLNTTFSISRSAGNTESSRAYTGGRFAAGASPTTATRTGFTYGPVGGGCYANCDGSTTEPILNVADFTCFLTKFAGGDPYANCDGSTTEPILNVADFTCFLTKFAAGC
jgi:hypothetical protein